MSPKNKKSEGDTRYIRNITVDRIVASTNLSTEHSQKKLAKKLHGKKHKKLK